MNELQKKFRYPGIRPFEQDDSNEFFGRDNDKSAFLQILQQQKCFVLYGKSGLGKTSLLRAGLLPAYQKLIQSNYPDGNRPVFTYIIRLGIKSEHDTVLLSKKIDDIICKAEGLQFLQINSFLPALAAKNPWHHFKNRQIELKSKNQEPLFVIVFDQFEELFTYNDNEVNSFKTILAELLSDHAPIDIRNYLGKKELEDDNTIPENILMLGQTGLPVKIILSIRSDKYNLLNRLKDAIPNINKYAYELLPLNVEQARQAIERPVRLTDEFYITPPYSYEPGVTDKILNFLIAKSSTDRDYSAERNYIEPYCLQIICSYLETARISGQKRSISADDIEDLAGVIELYYTRVIEQLNLESEVQEKVFDLLEEEMIYKKDNRRLIIYENILMDEFGLDADLLKKLTDTRLIREENYSSGGKSYEISHDALVLPILHARIKRKQGIKVTMDEINDPALLQYNQDILLKPNDYSAYKKRGDFYSYKGDYIKAIDDYQRATQLNSTDSDLYNSLALIYRNAGFFEDALHTFDIVIDLDPKYVYAYLDKGHIYYTLKEYDQSIKQYHEAIRINPDSAEAYNGLGMVYEEWQKFPEALEHYETAIKKDANYAAPILNRGNVFFRTGQKDKAKAAYIKVLEMNPSYSKAHYNLGIYYVGESKYDDAIACFEQTLKLSPTDDGAKQSLALTYTSKGELDKALLLFEQVNLKTDLLADDFYDLGYSFYDTEEFEKAGQCFQHTLDIQGEKASDALLMLGLAYVNSGQLADSLRSFTKLIQLEPDNAKAYNNMGICYEKLDRMSDAENNYRKAIDIDPQFEEAFNNLSLIYVNTGQWDKAISCLEEGVQKWPKNAVFHNMLGSVYISLKKYSDAEKYLNEAFKIDPDFSAVLNNLGIVAENKKDYSAAIQYFQKAIDHGREATAYDNLINVYEKAKLAENTVFDKFTASDYCYIGVAYFQQDKIAEAESCYLQCINKEPNFMHGYYNLGLLYNKEPKKAIDYFLQAHKLDPQDVDTLIAIGDTYVDLKDYDNAEGFFRNAENLLTQKAPDDHGLWVVYNGLGNVHDCRNQYHQAYDFYKKALLLEKNNTIINNNLGYICPKLGKLEEGLEFNEKAIKLSPDFAPPYDNLGSIYQEKKDFKKAFEYFQKAISMRPDHALYFANLGLLYVEAQQIDKALDHINRCIKLNPSLPEGWYGLGLIYFRKKEYVNAGVELKKAIEYDKFYKPAYILLGETAEELNSYEEAMGFYNRAQTIAPEDGYIKLKIASLLIKKDQLDKAMLVLNTLRADGTLPPGVQSLIFEKLGDVEMKRGNKLDASTNYTTSFLRNNLNESVLKKMVDFYQSQNNEAEASAYRKKLEAIQALKVIS